MQPTEEEIRIVCGTIEYDPVRVILGWKKHLLRWVHEAHGGVGWGRVLGGWSLRQNGPLARDMAWIPHNPEEILDLALILLRTKGYEGKLSWTMTDSGARIKVGSRNLMRHEGPPRLAALLCLTEAGELAASYLKDLEKKRN